SHERSYHFVSDLSKFINNNISNCCIVYSFGYNREKIRLISIKAHDIVDDLVILCESTFDNIIKLRTLIKHMLLGKIVQGSFTHGIDNSNPTVLWSVGFQEGQTHLYEVLQRNNIAISTRTRASYPTMRLTIDL